MNISIKSHLRLTFKELRELAKSNKFVNETTDSYVALHGYLTALRDARVISTSQWLQFINAMEKYWT
jgi:hypothetical protein